ncbi:hypothetical protein ACVIJX_004697 [Bradyrhizobium diazoefficiens]
MNDRPAEPGVGGRHHVSAHRPRLSLSRRHHRLSEPCGSGVAAVEYDGRLVLRGGSGRGAATYGTPEIYNTDHGKGVLRSHPPARFRSRLQMASGRGRYFDRGRTTLALARCRPEWLRSRRLDPAPKRLARCAAAHEEALESAGTPLRVMITDKLRSYGAARASMGFHVGHRPHKTLNNRAENSHRQTRRRERNHEAFQSAPSGSTVLVSSRSGRERFRIPYLGAVAADLRRASRERAFATWREISATSAIAESRTFENRLLRLGGRLS